MVVPPSFPFLFHPPPLLVVDTYFFLERLNLPTDVSKVRLKRPAQTNGSHACEMQLRGEVMCGCVHEQVKRCICARVSAVHTRAFAPCFARCHRKLELAYQKEHAQRQTDRQTDRQTETNTCTNKQTNKQTCKSTNKQTHSVKINVS